MRLHPFAFLRACSALFPFVAFAAVAACSSLTTPPVPEPLYTTSASASVSASAASAKPQASAAPAPTPAAPPGPPMDPNAKLVSKDLVVGKGAEAKTGSSVSVHYVGTLDNGTEFDSSKKRGKPFTFALGQGSVIRGWDQGVVGMKVGGKRKLVIPPILAYGAAGRLPVIPPAATLTFEIELIEVK